MSGKTTPTVGQVAGRVVMVAGVEIMVSQATGAPFNPASAVTALGEGFFWNADATKPNGSSAQLPTKLVRMFFKALVTLPWVR